MSTEEDAPNQTVTSPAPQTITPTQQLPPPPPKPTPEQEKYLQLVRRLTDASAILVVKVATCKCNHKDDCKVFKQAQKIADIIDEIQDVRLESVKEGAKTAIRRRRVRAR